MTISLDKLFKEINYASPDFHKKMDSLYPIKFNVEISSLPKFSFTLSGDNQSLNFIEHQDPQFSLSLDIFEALNAARSRGKCRNSIFANPVSRYSFFN